MPKPENPHDRFFKETLGDPELAAEFLQLYLLPELANQLDINRLVISDTSLSDFHLETHLADLLFRVGLKTGGEAYIYVLPDHKSYPDKWVGLQFLSYETRLYEAAKARDAKQLPAIFPIVFYHGKRPWPAKGNFLDLFDLPPGMEFLHEYLPGFRYQLINLADYEDSQIVGSAPLTSAFLLLKYVFRDELGEKFPEAFRQLGQAGLSQARRFWRAVLMATYLLETSEIGETRLREELKGVAGEEEGEKIMITTADRIAARTITREKPHWIQEGIAEGERKGSANLIWLLAKQRFNRLSAQTEGRIRALSLAQLEELAAALLNFKTAKDLTAWLHTRAKPQ